MWADAEIRLVGSNSKVVLDDGGEDVVIDVAAWKAVAGQASAIPFSPLDMLYESLVKPRNVPLRPNSVVENYVVPTPHRVSVPLNLDDTSTGSFDDPLQWRVHSQHMAVSKQG